MPSTGLHFAIVIPKPIPLLTATKKGIFGPLEYPATPLAQGNYQNDLQCYLQRQTDDGFRIELYQKAQISVMSRVYFQRELQVNSRYN